jgi:phosphate starvation-inducible protein PhoH and related proteins
MSVVDSALRFIEGHNKQENGGNGDLKSFSAGTVSIRTKKKNIQPRSPMQAAYIQAMQDHKMVFALGPAGTGKSYLAIAMAVSMLEQGKVERIILSRPALEAGEHIGFLPGEIKEKMDPYMRPLYDALQDTMSAETLQKKIASEEIEIAPLAFMRGRTLNNAFIILDESQNTSSIQMKMALTRFGESSSMVITGDPSQTDLPGNQESGLVDARDTLGDVDDIAFISFSDKDVIRAPLVAKIIKAYDTRSQKSKKE